MTTAWACPHGLVDLNGKRGDCHRCNFDIASRTAAHRMSGDARAAEVIELLNEPSAYTTDALHGRLEELVGRPVWTHEFVQDLALSAEARSWDHPADLRAHAIASMEALADGKPVVVVDTDP